MNYEEDTYKGSKKRPIWQWLFLYLVIGGAAYVLLYSLVTAKKGTSYSVNPASADQQYTMPSTLTPTASNIKEIAIQGNDFNFTPSIITLNKGETVTFVFTNNGAYPHNLNIPDLNIQTKTIDPGQTDSVSFTPNTAGSFPFICTVPGHADKGMTGTITVQ